MSNPSTEAAESDPSGKSPHAPGSKLDAGKPEAGNKAELLMATSLGKKV